MVLIVRQVGLLRSARTDAGVHAAINVLSLKLILNPPGLSETSEATEASSTAPLTALTDYINSFLTPAIRIWSIVRVQNSFNPRTLCDSRMYDYCLPTYVFLPPKPGTAMAIMLAAQSASASASTDTPATALADSTSSFWGDAMHHPIVSGTRRTEDEPHDFAQDMVKKRAWRITPDLMADLRAAAKMYEGSHNFHNFTIAKDFRDRSAQRQMKTLTVRDPHSASVMMLNLPCRSASLSRWEAANGSASKCMGSHSCCTRLYATCSPSLVTRINYI